MRSKSIVISQLRGEIIYYGVGRFKLNIVNILLLSLIFINIIYIAGAIFFKKSNGLKSGNFEPNFYQISQDKLKKEKCPDMELLTIENQRIRLSDLVGQVILMRFSDFAQSDLSALIYLNHIQEKFKSSGLQVIYVKTQSSWQDPKLFEPLYFKPLVESDGFLEAIFNSKAGDTILVDRNFNIRFKLNNLSNYFLYSQVYKFLFEDKLVSQGLEDREIARLLLSYDFINVENGRKEKIKESIENKPAIIMLFISPCFHCEEHKRITLLREMARIAKTGALVMLLFGEGNDLDSIEAFAKRNKIFGVMKIGIIQTTGENSRTEYHRLFDFEVDPRIIIYDEKAEPVFIENRENRKLVNPDYLRGFLG